MLLWSLCFQFDQLWLRRKESAKIRQEMKLFQLGPSRFLFVGFSAGGSLAAFTALRAPWQIGQDNCGFL
jgi:predicted esterase